MSAELSTSGLVPVRIEDEMKRSYLDYAMSVIVSRAIPDVRDGLKPVHRRILYAMHEAGYDHTKAPRKSARIVGDVIGKYHPHGDVAVYDALVRMAQDFSLRLPLIDGQGNFGSIDGDPPAAMRYTESRLTRSASYLLNDIDKETVDFQQNYDGSEHEPTVLPALFPNLLVNGSGGIAVGMATNIPPHNLGEVIDACCKYIENPECEALDFMDVIHGPDFPTGGTILGTGGIRSAFATGRGSIIIRGKTHIENNKDRAAIIIDEVPYMVNKAKLIERIAELVREKKIEGISDLRDESNKQGIRVVIEVKRDFSAEVILNQLYSFTPLQTSFGVNMLALDKGMPKLLNLKDVISSFVEFREEVVTKRTIFELNKARDRAHILIGLTIAVSNIDQVIAIIRSSKDPVEAKERLLEQKWPADSIASLVRLVDDKAVLVSDTECKFTEQQARAILEMRLQRLTALEKDKITDELQELKSAITSYLEILQSRTRLMQIIKDEMLEVKEKFATPRLTNIEEGEFERDLEDLIQKEEMVVTFTLSGYIKRVPLSTYRSQRRGGKGRSGLAMKDEDVTTDIFVGNTHTPMLFFSTKGQVYKLKLYKLPLGSPQSKGRPIINLLPLAEDERIATIMPLPEDDAAWDNLNIFFSTAKGNVRRNDMSDFKRIQANGKIAIRLDEDDRLVGVRVCSSDGHILLATKYGKCIRFPVSSLRVFKSRTSDGVRGIRLGDNDEVISISTLNGTEFEMSMRDEYLKIPLDIRRKLAVEFDPTLLAGLDVNLSHDVIKTMAEGEEFIFTVTSNGYGKSSSAYEYRITNRGGSGIANLNMTEKTGHVVGSMPADNTHEIMLITDTGRLIRCPLNTVRVTGRSSQGVILFKTDKDETVVSAALIADSGDDEELENAEMLASVDSSPEHAESKDYQDESIEDIDDIEDEVEEDIIEEDEGPDLEEDEE